MEDFFIFFIIILPKLFKSINICNYQISIWVFLQAFVFLLAIAINNIIFIQPQLIFLYWNNFLFLVRNSIN
jgi:hypothetical protein